MRVTTGGREYEESQHRVVPDVADDDRCDHARHEVLHAPTLMEQELTERVRARGCPRRPARSARADRRIAILGGPVGEVAVEREVGDGAPRTPRSAWRPPARCRPARRRRSSRVVDDRRDHRGRVMPDPLPEPRRARPGARRAVLSGCDSNERSRPGRRTASGLLPHRLPRRPGATSAGSAPSPRAQRRHDGAEPLHDRDVRRPPRRCASARMIGSSCSSERRASSSNTRLANRGERRAEDQVGRPARPGASRRAAPATPIASALAVT